MVEKPKFGIAIDGSCIGNPGKGAYRAVDIATGNEIFKHNFNITTNNVMEFCGLVHALKWRKENKSNLLIYSDSVTAISWVKNWNINTGLTHENNDKHWQFINVCLLWLTNNTKKGNIAVEKWETKMWGENPADFGNKTKTAITKEELRNWIIVQKSEEFYDITTLAKLERDFKL